MTQVSDNLLGLTLDEGSGFFIKESAQSENGVASITNVLLETYKFIGSQTRLEYLMPQMTQMNWALRAFENHVPDCRLLLEEARATPDPMVMIQKFDELMQMAAGSSAAPCLRVIPGTSLLQNAYKSAESIADGMHGQYRYDGYVHQNGAVTVFPMPITQVQLNEVGSQMAEGWVQMFAAADLEALSHLKTIVDVWDKSGLGVHNTVLSPEDSAAIMRSMGVYTAQPDWAVYDAMVDEETGAIAINGEPNPSPALISAAFPPEIRHSYHGGTRPLATWVTEHNAAMLTPLPFAAVQRIDLAATIPDVYQGVVRGLNGSKHVWNDSLYNELLATDTNPIEGRLYSVVHRGVSEMYMIRASEIPQVAALAGEQQLNEACAQMVHEAALLWHAGRPNSSGSGARTAHVILNLRDAARRNAALVPGIRRHLSDIALVLSDCPSPYAEAIVDIIDQANAAQPTESYQLAPFMRQLKAALKEAEPLLPTVPYTTGALVDGMTSNGFTVIGTGRWAPTSTAVVALVPVVGRGIAPVRFMLEDGALTPHQRLDVAVVLEEAPSTIYSPVRTMIATALLLRIVDYLNGRNTPTGYNFDVYNPGNPYGIGERRPSPRALLNRQMDRYEQALVHVLDNATVDQAPDVLRAAQRIADARYFLNYLDEVVDAIINREDWIYMLQSLIIGLLVHQGAQVEDAAGRPVVSLDAGVVPTEAARFLFEHVLADVRALPAYDDAVDAALNYGLSAPPDVANPANLNRIIRAEVLFDRARRGLDLLSSLLDGSNELVSNVHVGTVQNLIDVDLASGLMKALKTVFDRDYLALIDKIEFEAPWECAEWTTQFGAFAFFVESHPIHYRAVDMAREIAVDSGMAAVTSALARVGFQWTEIAPVALRVRGADQSQFTIGNTATMAGQAGSGSTGFLNNAPVAHQGLKVTVVCPSYDIEAYNLVKAYLTMNTSRTYFAQPVGTDISDTYVIRYPNGPNALLDLALNEGAAGARRMMLAGDGMALEKTPALANVAIIMPYVAAYLNKQAITRDVAVPQIFEVDESKSLATTSGVIILPDQYDPALLTERNGIAVTVQERRSISTALPWVGA